jgi:C-terminal processing protease CtpA/Prc
VGAPLDGLLFERLGVTVDERRIGDRRFVEVQRVGAGGPAAQIGMQPGDLVPALRPEVGRGRGMAYRIQDREVLAGIVGQLGEGTFIELDVYRDTNGDQRYELLNGRLKLR